MICTYCKRVFHGKSYDVSRFWNTRKGTVDTCSISCYDIVKKDHKNYMDWSI